MDFSSSVICVLFDLAHIQLSFCKFVVEVDLVFFFSILHNLLIYSGNFYTKTEKTSLQLCRKLPNRCLKVPTFHPYFRLLKGFSTHKLSFMLYTQVQAQVHTLSQPPPTIIQSMQVQITIFQNTLINTESNNRYAHKMKK